MPEEYTQLAERLRNLAKDQKGFLGIDSITDSQGNGVSIILWESIEGIKAWKADKLHRYAQEKGKTEWYENYSVTICKVVEEYQK